MSAETGSLALGVPQLLRTMPTAQLADLADNETLRVAESTLSHQQLSRLAERGGVEVDDVEFTDNGARRHIYRVGGDIQAAAAEIRDARVAMPCGHRFGIQYDPIEDPDRGDYCCPHDACDGRYTRATVERLRIERGGGR